MMRAETLRTDRHILIAGLGSIGRRHLRNLRALGFSRIDGQSRRGQPPGEPPLRVSESLDQALAARPDVVFVCTATAAHVPVAVRAALAGCDLFIEKPLSHSTEGLAELAWAVEAQGLTAMVGFDFRFDPGLCRIKAVLAAGDLGRVLSVQCQVGQYLPDWRPDCDYRGSYSARRDLGGGVVLDLIHELDYLGWLLGPVAEVTCLSGHVSTLEIETEDVAVIGLRFASGAVGGVHLDYLQRVPSRTCRLVAERGTVEWDYHARRVVTRVPGEPTDEFSYPDFSRNDRFLAELQHFFNCLDGAATPPVDLASAGLTLSVALAARASADCGQVLRLQ